MSYVHLFNRAAQLCEAIPTNKSVVVLIFKMTKLVQPATNESEGRATMFMTIEKYRAMNSFDYAQTRLGRLLGFVRIARANNVSLRQLYAIVKAWNHQTLDAITAPHRLMFPRF